MRGTALLLVLLSPLALAGQVRAVGKPIAGEYVRTHDETVTGWAMPYVEEYAAANRIDLEKIRKQLFPAGIPAAAGQRYSLLSSNEHIRGNWTFVRSGSVVVYQLQQVEVGKTAEKAILVLYNRRLPPEVIDHYLQVEWRLALFDSQYVCSADRPFTTRIRHDEDGLWDMMYTGLETAVAGPVLKILYAHTGGGGGRDQEFTFWFSLSARPWRLALVKSAQTIDLYR